MPDQIFIMHCAQLGLLQLGKAINNKVDGNVKVTDMPSKAVYNEMPKFGC